MLIAIVLAALIAARLTAAKQMRERELGRFAGNSEEYHAAGGVFDAWFAFLARRFLRDDAETRIFLKDNEMSLKLQAAGLDTASGRGQFLAIQFLCYLSWPLLALSAWVNLPRSYAAVSTIVSFALIVLIPQFWLKQRVRERNDLIQRELPLLIDLVNMTASAGWDSVSGLEQVIDAAAPEYPGHPLFKEFQRARWLAASGYAWPDCLDRAARRVNDESVTQVTRALAQAIEKGGDRSGQLGGIAEAVQRNCYSDLDRRLAAVPLKALMVTIVLSLSYFAILLTPSVFGIPNTAALF